MWTCLAIQSSAIENNLENWRPFSFNGNQRFGITNSDDAMKYI